MSSVGSRWIHVDTDYFNFDSKPFSLCCCGKHTLAQVRTRTRTHTPGELQSGNTCSGTIRAAAPVLFGEGQVLHAGPAVQNLHTLTLHELLYLADVPSLKQQLNGTLQNLWKECIMTCWSIL